MTQASADRELRAEVEHFLFANQFYLYSSRKRIDRVQQKRL